MNIVVLGNKRSGKSSILKLIFQKLSRNEALFLESTSKIEEYIVNNNPFTKCSFYDYPGNFEISQMSSLERKHLQSASILLYILDAKDEPYNKTLEKFLTLESEVYEMNPSCTFELLIHKLDGEMFSSDELKLSVFNEVSELIRLNSSERSIPSADIHMTSIQDLSIYITLSKILQKCTPMLIPVQDLLDLFISECLIDKVYVIDLVSKLFIATDSAPVDFISYDLSCDLIDVMIEISTLYGLTEEENFEQAYDEKSAAFVILDNGFNLYLRFLDHLLAVVCVVKDSSYQKKEIIDENFEVLKKTFEKIARTSEKIIREGKK